jgi:hypothetical protein
MCSKPRASAAEMWGLSGVRAFMADENGALSAPLRVIT